MKKRNMIITIAILTALIWVMSRRKKPGMIVPVKQRVKATYNGTGLMVEAGAMLLRGDPIEGDLNPDGSITCEFYGNGIVASRSTVVIPAGEIINIRSI